MQYKYIKGIFWGMFIVVFWGVISAAIILMIYFMEKFTVSQINVSLRIAKIILDLIGDFIILYNLRYLKNDNKYFEKAIIFQLAYLLICILSSFMNVFVTTKIFSNIINCLAVTVNVAANFFIFFGISEITFKHRLPKLSKRLKVAFLIYTFLPVVPFVFLFLWFILLAYYSNFNALLNSVVTLNQLLIGMIICFTLPILTAYIYTLRIVWVTYKQLSSDSPQDIGKSKNKIN